jgi:AcrR family transcriptional regulator
MSDIATLGRAAPTRIGPRKRDAEATRAAILAAAKSHFGRSGYDHVALRDIAADAGCDVALIKRYFGGKEGLFTEALRVSFHPDRLREWDLGAFPREAATMLADGAHVGEERTHSFQFLLRAATSPTTAPLLNLAGRRGRGGPRAGAGGGLHRLPGRTPDPR